MANFLSWNPVTYPRQPVTNHMLHTSKFCRLQWSIEALDLELVQLFII